MPTPVKAWPDSTGKLHLTIEQWQRAELLALVKEPLDANDAEHQLDAVVNTLFAKSDRVVEVLTTGPRTRPKARKAAGTTNPRRAAKRATVPANGNLQPHPADDIAAPRG